MSSSFNFSHFHFVAPHDFDQDVIVGDEKQDGGGPDKLEGVHAPEFQEIGRK